MLRRRLLSWLPVLTARGTPSRWCTQSSTARWYSGRLSSSMSRSSWNIHQYTVHTSILHYSFLVKYLLLLLVWHAPLGVRSAKRRHQSPEWTILGHSYRLIQWEIVWSQVLLDSLHPRGSRTSWWSPPVLWRGSSYDTPVKYRQLNLSHVKCLLNTRPMSICKRHCSMADAKTAGHIQPSLQTSKQETQQMFDNKSLIIKSRWQNIIELTVLIV